MSEHEKQLLSRSGRQAILKHTSDAAQLETAGQNEAAIVEREKALQLAERYLPAGDRFRALCYSALGQLYARNGHISKALQIFAKARNASATSEDPFQLMRNYYDLAKGAAAGRRYDESEDLLKKAVDVVDKLLHAERKGLEQPWFSIESLGMGRATNYTNISTTRSSADSAARTRAKSDDAKEEVKVAGVKSQTDQSQAAEEYLVSVATTVALEFKKCTLQMALDVLFDYVEGMSSILFNVHHTRSASRSW